MTLTVANLGPDRIPDMVSVISRVTGQPVSTRRWQRKYISGGPAGMGKGRVLYQNDRPVGCMGAIPFRIAAGDRVLKGWQLCDIFIDRSLRDGRASPMLYEGLLEEIWRDGGDLTFGFCNPMSAALLKRRLGHGEIGRMDPFDIQVPVGVHKTAWSGRWRRHLLAPLYLGALRAGMPDRMVTLNADTPDCWLIAHDTDYLASRHAMGARTIHLFGRRLMVTPGTIMKVGGMEPFDDTEMPTLLVLLGRLAATLGASSIRFMVDRRDRLHGQLTRLLGLPPAGWYLTAATRPGLEMPTGGLCVCFADYENF